MRFMFGVTRVLAGVFLIAHGLAHAPGVLGSFDLASFDDVSRQPNLLFTGAGDALVQMLGVVWAIAGLAFVVAGAGVVIRPDWARKAAWLAVAISLPVTLLWYQDAAAGLVINVAVVAVLIGSQVWTTVSAGRATSPSPQA
jgi:hypothetical protein